MPKHVCPRCLNEDPKYFYKGSKGVYCRRCIAYGRVLVDDTFGEEKEEVPLEVDAEYHLDFELTKEQKELSHELMLRAQKEDVLVHAVTGAGKTELVMETIREFLKQGKRVGIAIPRRQVVVEIGERMAKAFTKLHVVYVCGGHSEEKEGDLIVCTTHQLYRYYQYFDLLILDEPDAFPYKGNEVLQGIVRTSCKGHLVALTATPDESLQSLSTLTLFKRPHHHPLVVPKILLLPTFAQIIYLTYVIRGLERVLIFVPTRKFAKKLGKFLKLPYFTSETEHKDEMIRALKSGEIRALITTTVLERGVTFSNVSVIILQADHSVFDKASMIQIAGRVGRDPKYPTGECLFLCRKRSFSAEEAKKEIMRMNA